MREGVILDGERVAAERRMNGGLGKATPLPLDDGRE
jgi:hypothetical protein